jgi:hypothetical protein
MNFSNKAQTSSSKGRIFFLDSYVYVEATEFIFMLKQIILVVRTIFSRFICLEQYFLVRVL